MLQLLVSLSMLASLTSCSYINKYLGEPNDWWGEQIVEAAVKIETGVDVDLTP